MCGVKRADRRRGWGSWPAVITVLGLWTASSYRPPGALQPPLWFSLAPQVRGNPCMECPFAPRPKQTELSALTLAETSSAYRSTEPRVGGAEAPAQEVKGGLHHRHCNADIFTLPRGATEWTISLQAAPSPPIRVLGTPKPS